MRVLNFAAGAQWRDDWVMRLSVTCGTTTARDIEMSAAAIMVAWRAERPAQARRVDTRDAAQPGANHAA